MKNNIKAEIQSFLKQQLISGNITTNELLEMVHDISKTISYKNSDYNTNNQCHNKEQADSENLFAHLNNIIGNVFE